MSFFDQPYYASTKAYMCLIGLWPEQSKYMRIMLHLTMFAIALTLAVPGVIRLYDAWRNINVLARNTTIFLIGTLVLALQIIEKHWKMLQNKPAVTVLDEYTEIGRYIIVVYSTSIYGVVILYLGLCLSPVILDFIDPVNETRPKIYVAGAEYGVDEDKYYWFIIAHAYIVAAIAISIVVGVGSMYITGAVHACALFEVVRFNLELIAHEHTVNTENAVTRRSDSNYIKICDCIILHIEAISFADLIESNCYQSFGMILATMGITIVMSGVQAMVNLNHPAMLIQQGTLIGGLAVHLYMASIPGQELIDHSGKIYTTAYNLGWQDMPVNTQKLLIPILIRSSIPCYFTGGKVYVLSIETFGLVIRTMLSYITIFLQMI